MPETPRHRAFAHEIAFLIVWLGQLIALVVTGTVRPADWLLVALSVVMIWLMWKGRAGFWYHVRLWFPLAAFDVCYLWMAGAIPRLRPWRADAALFSLDRMAFGECFSAKVAPWISGGLHEGLAIAYLSFFALYTVAFVIAAIRGGAFRTVLLRGFYAIYAAGLIGYTLFPASGSFRNPALRETLPALAPGGPVSRLNDAIVLNGCNGVDVFPSLHTAVTLFLLLSAFSGSRRWFAVLLVPCLLIIAATIGLQYHYAADVLAGAIIGAIAWWCTVRRFYRAG